MLLPSGDASALAEEPFVDSVVASGNVEEVPVSQACQSVLDEVVVAPPVLEVISCLLSGPPWRCPGGHGFRLIEPARQ